MLKDLSNIPIVITLLRFSFGLTGYTRFTFGLSQHQEVGLLKF